MEYKIPGSRLVKMKLSVPRKVKLSVKGKVKVIRVVIIKNLSVEHKIPGSSEGFLALAASKAHSLST